MSAGDGSQFGEKPNWVTQIVSSGNFTLPSLGNKAVGGATSTDVINNQLLPMESMVSTGKVDYVVLMIGANDVTYSALDYLNSGDLDATLSAFVTTVTANIKKTLGDIASVGSVHQIMANIPDVTQTPLVQQYLTQYHATPAQVQAIRNAIITANTQIDSYALTHGIPVFDLYNASINVVAHAPLTLAGVSFTKLFASDNYHPAPVDHGLFANAYIDAANRAYNAHLTPISDQQIVRNVGRAPTIVGPTYYNIAPYVLMPVPEPASSTLAVLAGVALVGMCAVRQRRKLK